MKPSEAELEQRIEEYFNKFIKVLDEARKDPEFNRCYLKAKQERLDQEANGGLTMTEEEMLDGLETIKYEIELYELQKLKGM